MVVYLYEGEYFEYRKQIGDVGMFYVLDSNLQRVYRWVPMGYLPETAISVNILKFGEVVEPETKQVLIFNE